jgi:glycerophosphoryl diester phosphodiesterase
MSMTNLQVFAHRGASGQYPENTLLSFQRAFELGARWIELDTQQVDGRLVVFHDDRLERTTNGTGFLSSLSFEALRRLDAGQGQRIPLLEEVLDLVVARRAGVNIELKGVATAVPVAQMLDNLLARGRLTPEQLLVSSFLADELDQFRQLMPQLRCAPVYETLPENLEDCLARLSPWSVHLDHPLIDAALVARIAACACRVFAWTVNDRDHAQRLAQLGVRGIFTDFPERFCRA